MRVRKLAVLFVLALTLAAISGCGDDVVLVSLLVAPDNPSVNVAATQQFTVTGTFSDTTTSTTIAGLAWSSATTTVATIDASTGLATCATAGTSVITATAPVASGSSQTVSDTTTLTCVAVP